jgi:hypothetical protein
MQEITKWQSSWNAKWWTNEEGPQAEKKIQQMVNQGATSTADLTSHVH